MEDPMTAPDAITQQAQEIAERLRRQFDFNQMFEDSATALIEAGLRGIQQEQQAKVEACEQSMMRQTEVFDAENDHLEAALVRESERREECSGEVARLSAALARQTQELEDLRFRMKGLEK